MIGRLTGAVAGHDAEGALVIDVAGVGYEVTAPQGTLGRVTADEAGRVTIWVHTHVREEVLALYGFSSEHERTAFRILLGVSNVGPKIAVAVLGALPAAELARAIARQDLAALKGISGVGKRIAERLLLELRDELPEAPPGPGGVPDARPVSHAPVSDDDRVRSALVGMGFKPAEAERAAASVVDKGAPFEALLREALAHLSR